MTPTRMRERIIDALTIERRHEVDVSIITPPAEVVDRMVALVETLIAEAKNGDES